MPVLYQSTYKPSPFLINGHLETIFTGLFRNIRKVQYDRERLFLSDGDFVDLDWQKNGSDHLVILSHGLEGHSSRQYMAGMARMFSEQNWDVLAWNCRSCSGEMNLRQRMYHHGDIDDISEVIRQANTTRKYETIILVGFSMGASISMKYLGVNGKNIPGNIRGCVVFSAPTDLKAGADALNEPGNAIYFNRFLKNLKKKLEIKHEQFPGVIDLENFKSIRVWQDFDEFFTAPLNGFANANEFYESASAQHFMPDIAVPTLLVQALNDPILPPACYPEKLCEKLPNITLEMPKQGGHIGFWRPWEKYAWSEKRAWAFVSKKLNLA